MIRRSALAALIAILGMGAAAAVNVAFAGERALCLVMFREPACPWCEAWDREVGDAYALTAEGKEAPLRRVDMTAQRPNDLAAIKGIRFSPTFVLVSDGQEIGRITGYPGEDFFWPLLNDLLNEHRREDPTNERS